MVKIKLENLSKSFGKIKAVDGLNLEIEQGEILGFLGPNGAGKSTTMKMISGFLKPSDGAVYIDGKNIFGDVIESKTKIGFLPEGCPIYGDVSVKMFLGFIADIRGYKGKEKRDKIENVVKLAKIEDVLNQNIDTLSKGYSRRVGFAQAIIHNPEILMLDEPTDGLDPNQKIHIRKIIKDMRKDKTIIISTHILDEVEEICDKVVVIADGKLKAFGKISDIVKNKKETLEEAFIRLTK